MVLVALTTSTKNTAYSITERELKMNV